MVFFPPGHFSCSFQFILRIEPEKNRILFYSLSRLFNSFCLFECLQGELPVQFNSILFGSEGVCVNCDQILCGAHQITISSIKWPYTFHKHSVPYKTIPYTKHNKHIPYHTKLYHIDPIYLPHHTKQHHMQSIYIPYHTCSAYELRRRQSGALPRKCTSLRRIHTLSSVPKKPKVRILFRNETHWFS